jgi:hypothetical protein
MIPVSRIREFLRHPDADVRVAAARYFLEAHAWGEATMEDWWAVVDACGMEDARALLPFLRRLPETDASFTRLLEALRGGVTASVWFGLRSRWGAVPFEMLSRRIEEVRGVAHLIAPEDLRHAEDRLALAAVPPEALWVLLLVHAEECDGKDGSQHDALLVMRLAEALAWQSESATPRVLEILGDESIEDWREIFAVELAGALRCREAIDLLIGKLRIDADDLLERVSAALVRIGDESIPARIAAGWDDEEWDFRHFAHPLIASFRGAESAALLRELWRRESDEALQIMMAVSLLEMLPDDPATLEEMRQFILRWPEDQGIEQLDLLLATVATMAEWEFPERAEWRALAIAEETRLRAIFAQDAEHDEKVRAGMLAGLSFREAGGLEPAEMLDDLDEWEDDEEEMWQEPIVRTAPKIGRNEPCPCASGKKYKKCCGKVA